MLRSCYVEALRVADEIGAATVAFPASAPAPSAGRSTTPPRSRSPPSPHRRASPSRRSARRGSCCSTLTHSRSSRQRWRPADGQLAEAPAAPVARTGQPSARSRRPPPTIAARGPNGASTAAASQPVEGANRAWMSSPARFGRSAPSVAVAPARTGGRGSAAAPPRSTCTAAARPRRRTSRPAGRSRRRCPRRADHRAQAAVMDAQAARTAASSYCRSTFIARTTTGRVPAELETAAGELSPGGCAAEPAAAATRSGPAPARRPGRRAAPRRAARTARPWSPAKPRTRGRPRADPPPGAELAGRLPVSHRSTRRTGSAPSCPAWASPSHAPAPRRARGARRGTVTPITPRNNGWGRPVRAGQVWKGVKV